jgi:hypothetical protein
MRGSRVFVLLAALCSLIIGSETVSSYFEQAVPDEEIIFEDTITLEFKHKSGHETAFDIREDIRRGQEFLRDKVAGSKVVREEKRITSYSKKGRKKERIVSEKILKPNFLLAVEDLKERKIRSVQITAEGGVSGGFEVTKSRGTGVGSRFEVKYPENMAVLALRTTVRADKNEFKEVVYTPYSPEIDTWHMRKAGLDYLTQQLELAYRDLETRKVRLAGFEQLDADISPTEVALVLSIIEHIDPLRFTNCEEGKEIGLIHEVLTIVGANTTEAYAYSKSPAGARGLFQIIPDTYRRLREKYPKAGLTKDFVAGCTDHVNAAKASMLLFDSDLADLTPERMSAMRKNLRSVGMYLAAAYNCGSGKVQKSARLCGDKWTCRLPEETKIYLKKFDVVWELRKTLDR